MLKLLKHMKNRERWMVLGCIALIVGQIYFDLTMPDYMSDLTVLINTPGSEMTDILSVGAKMLGCTLASAALAIACGFLTSRIAAGYSFAVREKLFSHVMLLGKAETSKFSIPSLITRTTNDITQLQMIVVMGLQSLVKAPIMAVWAIIKILGKSWELSAVTASAVVVICTTVLAIMSVCLPRFRKVQKLTDTQNRMARENLTGINVVHACNAEKYQTEKFDVPNTESASLFLDAARDGNLHERSFLGDLLARCGSHQSNRAYRRCWQNCHVQRYCGVQYLRHLCSHVVYDDGYGLYDASFRAGLGRAYQRGA